MVFLSQSTTLQSKIFQSDEKAQVSPHKKSQEEVLYLNSFDDNKIQRK